MNKKQLVIALIIFTVFTLPIFAQGKHSIDKFEEECMNRGSTTAGMANCEVETRKKWDIELNKYYKLLMGILPEDAKVKLRESQLAWVKFRDAEFISIENMYHQMATMYIPVRSGDRTDIVKQRVLQLKSYYEESKEYYYDLKNSK